MIIVAAAAAVMSKKVSMNYDDDLHSVSSNANVDIKRQYLP